MRILNKLSSLLLSCIALGLTGAPATGLAAALNLTIGNYAVVGATKVNSSTVQYKVTATVTNGGSNSVSKLTMSAALSPTAGVSLTGSSLNFGAVPSGATATSSNTFSIRFPSTVSSSGAVSQLPALLTWTVSGPAPTANISELEQGPYVTGRTYHVSGANSKDYLGLPLSFHWTLASVPAGSTVVPTGLTSAKVFFTPDRAGNYVFQLVVDDGLFRSKTASVTIVVGLGGSVLVPGIVGQTQAAATSALMAAGLKLGTVTTAASSTVPAGSVISESPVAGTAVPAGSSVSLVVASGLTAQTITFGTAPALVVGGTAALIASGGASGNPVVFSSTTPGTCAVSGTNGSTVTGVATGTCAIAGNQAGNANYSAAPQVTQSITVGPGSQAIVFGTAPVVVFGGTGTVSATGGASGNPVVFSSTTPGTCTVSGTNGSTVTAVAAGTCTIAANQAGNASLNAAPQVSQNITVTLASQAITFGPAPAVPVGGTGTFSATGGVSGNPVVFSSTTPTTCTSSGPNGGTVTGVAAGPCTIAANQAGSANYSAAPQVTQSVTVGAGGQTITFSAVPSVAVGGSGTLSATASSGLRVTFSSTTPATCSVSGTTVTGVAAGPCNVAADQAGNASYNAAPQVVRAIAIQGLSQSITFATVPAFAWSGTALLSATSSGGLAVTFASLTPTTCSVSGTVLYGVAPGSCVVAASQAGNSSYDAAIRVTQTVAVLAAGQTISFGPTPILLAGGTGALSATATSALPVTFSSTTPAVCSVSGASVTALAAGTCTVAGNQAGNSSYSAASQATQSFTVGSTLVTVPDVLGYPQAAASSALATSGLSPGTVSTASSDTVAAGSIVSESPAAGAQVGYGSAVNLVMSTGPTTGTALILVNPSQALQGGGGCSSYTLNAGPGTPFDDDGAIFLNGAPIFLDSVHTAHTVAPVTFDACAGDMLEVVGYNWATPCEWVGPLSLTDNTSGLAHVLDAAGYGSAAKASLCNNLPGGGYPFYDRTFAIPGASVSVAITGQLTHFVQGTSTASFGAGITVQSLTVTSSTSAVASLIVDPAAAIGGRDVSVTTGSETASLPSALAVTAAQAALAAVFPSSASVGTAGLVVTLVGRYTHFAQGTTSVDFGPGVTLESLTVTSPTSASAIVTVDPAASASTNRVSVTTGTEVVSLSAALSIYAESPPSCATGLPTVNYSQSAIDLGQGAQTAFNGGVWNAGALGAQWVQVDLAIDQSISEIQFYTAQSPDGATSYSVYVASSPIGSAFGALTPVASTSGNTVNLQQITLPFTPVTGRFVEIVANGGPSLTGLQNAMLACSQGGGAAGIGAISPNTGSTGTTALSVALAGAYTHFVQGATTVNFGPGITVASLTVNSPTSATAVISIAATAALTFNAVTATTGTEVATLANAFSVTAAGPGSPVVPGAPTSVVAAAGNGQATVSFVAPASNGASPITGYTVATGTVAVTYDATADFSSTNNPNGAWSLGYSPAGGAAYVLTLFDVDQPNAYGPVWRKSNYITSGTPDSWKNNSTTTTPEHVAPGQMALDPGPVPNGDIAILRFTAPATGAYGVTGQFFAGNVGAMSGSVVLKGAIAAPLAFFANTTDTSTFSFPSLALKQGDTVDLAVGNNGNYLSGTTPVRMVVTLLSPVPSAVDANAATTGLTHLVTGLTDGATYTFTVTATNAVGTGPASSPSNGVVPTGPVTAPGAPTIGTATAGNAHATVTFQAPPTDGGTAITGYTVTSNPAGGIDGNTGTANLSHVVTGLANGTAYTFTVAATNAVGTGAASSPSNSVTPATLPGAPTIGTATAGNSQATVTFAASGADGGSAITGYIVVSNPAGGVDVNAGTMALSHVVSGLTAGTSYTFTVMALNAIGAGPASLPSNSVVPIGTAGLISASPANGQQGETNLPVILTGRFTNWAQGTTTASFGSGITVNSMTVNSATSATAVVSVSSTAPVGTSAVTITTGSQVVSLTGGFSVIPGAPILTSISPASGAQGQTSLALTLTGQYTHFTQGVTAVSFGSGVTATVTSVLSPTSMSVAVNIDSTAAVGPRSATVTTGTEVVNIANSFTIAAGVPVLASMTPAAGVQGATGLSVTLTAQFTHFVQGTSTASFGAGITVSSLTVNSATSATAVLTISSSAAVAASAVTVSTGPELVTLANGFEVTSSTPILKSVRPASGSQGQKFIQVAIAGQATHFTPGTTVANFGAGTVVTAVNVTSPTSAVASVSIDAAAAVGPRTVTVTTASELVTLASGFAINGTSAVGPSMTLSLSDPFIAAGQTMTLTPVVTDANGNVLSNAALQFTLTVTPAGTPVGSAPVVNGLSVTFPTITKTLINPDPTGDPTGRYATVSPTDPNFGIETGGVYNATVTLAQPALAATTQVRVFPNAAGETLVTGARYAAQLDAVLAQAYAAEQAQDPTLLAAAQAALTAVDANPAFSNAVLSIGLVQAPPQGALPSPAQLVANGFAAGPQDAQFGATLARVIADLQTLRAQTDAVSTTNMGQPTINILEAALTALNADLTVLAGLSPSTLAMIQQDAAMNQLLGVEVPAMLTSIKQVTGRLLGVATSTAGLDGLIRQVAAIEAGGSGESDSAIEAMYARTVPTQIVTLVTTLAVLDLVQQENAAVLQAMDIAIAASVLSSWNLQLTRQINATASPTLSIDYVLGSGSFNTVCPFYAPSTIGGSALFGATSRVKVIVSGCSAAPLIATMISGIRNPPSGAGALDALHAFHIGYDLGKLRTTVPGVITAIPDYLGADPYGISDEGLQFKNGWPNVGTTFPCSGSVIVQNLDTMEMQAMDVTVLGSCQ